MSVHPITSRRARRLAAPVAAAIVLTVAAATLALATGELVAREVAALAGPPG